MEISNNSKFNICASFNLSLDDINCLTLLYQPLIGSDALTLYLTLNSLIQNTDLKSSSYNHLFLYDMLNIDEKKFLSVRKILEGIGLLSTYKNENDYIYLICSPLTPKAFISDGVLGVMLYSKVGEVVFNNLINRFKVVKIDKSNYTNISASFDDIFTTDNQNGKINLENDYVMDKKRTRKINISNSDFDFNTFISNIDTTLLEFGVTELFKKRIIETSTVYSFDEGDMASLYNESINRYGLFDEKILKKKAKILYTYKYNQELPKVDIKPEIKDNDFINNLEFVDGEKFLRSILGDYFKKEDVITLNEIYNELNFNPTTIKIMVMYVINKLTEKETVDNPVHMPPLSYFKKVADDWILEGTTDEYKAYNRYVIHAEEVQKPKYKKKVVSARKKDKYEIENSKKDAMEGMEVL